jgi:hypothetical protein
LSAQKKQKLKLRSIRIDPKRYQLLMKQRWQEGLRLPWKLEYLCGDPWAQRMCQLLMPQIIFGGLRLPQLQERPLVPVLQGLPVPWRRELQELQRLPELQRLLELQRLREQLGLLKLKELKELHMQLGLQGLQELLKLKGVQGLEDPLDPLELLELPGLHTQLGLLGLRKLLTPPVGEDRAWAVLKLLIV